MNDDPLAYFITWTVYGTWLQGDVADGVGIVVATRYHNRCWPPGDVNVCFIQSLCLTIVLGKSLNPKSAITVNDMDGKYGSQILGPLMCMSWSRPTAFMERRSEIN